MVRQTDGSVKAFYNVCRHRGNPLVAEETGSVKRFVCKYHSWAFMPDGTLNFAPDKEDFPEGNPCGKVRLAEVSCETFAGFVWINMDLGCVSGFGLFVSSTRLCLYREFVHLPQLAPPITGLCANMCLTNC